MYIIMYRNRLEVANDMRIAVSNINPRMDEFVSKRHEQRPHRIIMCIVLFRVNCCGIPRIVVVPHSLLSSVKVSFN